jgi:15-cis-phytoene synthase / lycopene beta-cyclase
LDLYKILAVIIIAFVATLPWDSYLIRRGIWTYPQDAVLGPTLFAVPAEELFFFIIQTYLTSMLYLLLNKPILHAQFLTNREESSIHARRTRGIGQLLLLAGAVTGAILVRKGAEGTYLGLILAWACPFALLTWTFSGHFIIRLPLICIATPICLPTLYLWVVDELALGRGTWAIVSGTKLGWCLWGKLELEEAVFFLLTNALIVFGSIALDRALAVLDTFPDQLGGTWKRLPPPALLLKAMLTNPERYDMNRVRGIREAISILGRKSRSFYLASAVFPGRLRLDLVLL